LAVKIGVLALQGAFREHINAIKKCGCKAVEIKFSGGLEDIDGLIIPGGESTCLSKLMHVFAIDQAIVKRHAEGMKLWGTCAGAILLAKTIIGERAHLGLIDIEIERNGFGSQMDSFASEAFIPKVSPLSIPLTFIRAPKIIKVGNGIDILLKIDDYIAAAESDDVLVTVFHPELTPSLAFHRYFARKCGLSPRVEPEKADGAHSVWDRTSWMRFASIIEH